MTYGCKSINADGGSWVNRLGLWCAPLLALFLVLGAAFLPQSQPLAQDTPETPEAPDSSSSHSEAHAEAHVEAHSHVIEVHEAARDSLVVEINRYSQLISAMRDSLSISELGLGIELGPEDKEHLESSIREFTVLIDEIGSELGQMDLEIVDNQISLLDEEGEGIIINIPENIDEQLSQGLNVLSQIILSELPDSVRFDPQGVSGWRELEFNPFGKAPKKEKRKVIKGNIVKVWDRLQVSPSEDVRGHVVVVFGDAEVSGRVDGNVVVVFGDLQLTEDAEVTGEVVAIGGRLDQDPDADVSDVVVVDPWGRLGADGPEGLFSPGPMNFLLGQGEFLAMLLFSVLAFGLAPAGRLDRAMAVLASRPLPSLGMGLLGSFGLHLVAFMVMAILVLTVIGIPVALLVAVALVVLGVLSVGLVALWLGGEVCGRFFGGCNSRPLAVVIGLAVLHLVSFTGQLIGVWADLAVLSTLLTVLGLAIKFGAYLFGLGALILGRFGSSRAS